MYRKRYQMEAQIPLDEFYMAFGGRLSKSNRWVKPADMIPWDVVEKRYAEQFKSTVGNPAYPVRVAFGALIIKEKLKITDEETVLQIRENPYLQYFIGYTAYSDKQPFHAIACGKAKAMYEYGATKISLSLVVGYATVDRISWDNYNEFDDLKRVVTEYKAKYWFYPAVVCADKIYRSHDNLEFYKEHGIRLSGQKLGRPHGDPKQKRETSRIERKDDRMRIPIEGKFGEGKRCYALVRLATKLEETSETSIMVSFVAMNLERFGRDRARSFIFVFFYWISRLQARLYTLFLRGLHCFVREKSWNLSTAIAQAA